METSFCLLIYLKTWLTELSNVFLMLASWSTATKFFDLISEEKTSLKQSQVLMVKTLKPERMKVLP